MTAVVLPPLTERHSPNQSSRHGATVTHIVWHATEGHYEPSIRWLCTPTVLNPDGSVKSGPDASCHLMLREDGGECAQLVPIKAKAWHAYPTWNAISVGVEHASLARGFASHAQLERSARVLGWLCRKYGIPPVFGLHRPRGIVRHRDLGASGGGHVDGPSDAVWFGEYLPLVAENVDRGGYRDKWAV